MHILSCLKGEKHLLANWYAYIFMCEKWGLQCTVLRTVSNISQSIKEIHSGIQKIYEPQREKSYFHVISGQRRLGSACVSVHSDRSVCCPHEETLQHWLSKM